MPDPLGTPDRPRSERLLVGPKPVRVMCDTGRVPKRARHSPGVEDNPNSQALGREASSRVSVRTHIDS